MSEKPLPSVEALLAVVEVVRRQHAGHKKRWLAVRGRVESQFNCANCASLEALDRAPLPKSEDDVRAEEDILSKSVASMNLAAAYLWKAAEAIGATHPSDPCVYHAQRLQIAAGAIQRLLALRSKPEEGRAECEKCGSLNHSEPWSCYRKKPTPPAQEEGKAMDPKLAFALRVGDENFKKLSPDTQSQIRALLAGYPNEKPTPPAQEAGK